jgi:hypothetical protein
MGIARISSATAALLLAATAVAEPAAADGGMKKAWSSACRHDAFSFCRLQALEYNVPGVRDCLVHNLEKVSDTCRGVIKAAAQNQLSPTPTAPAPH